MDLIKIQFLYIIPSHVCVILKWLDQKYLYEKDCNDGNHCSINTCNPIDGTCINIFIDGCINFTNGVACVTTDKCNQQICSDTGDSCLSIPLICSNTDVCTVETCISPLGICESMTLQNCSRCSGTSCFSDTPCYPSVCSLDGNRCITEELLCDDNDPCSSDSCNLYGCDHEQISNCIQCSNNFSCITTDFCYVQYCSLSNDYCVSVPLDCSDDNECTDDYCLENGVCAHIKISGCETISSTTSTTSEVSSTTSRTGEVSSTSTTGGFSTTSTSGGFSSTSTTGGFSTTSTTGGFSTSSTTSKISTTLTTGGISTTPITSGISTISTTGDISTTIGISTGHYTESGTTNPSLCNELIVCVWVR